MKSYYLITLLPLIAAQDSTRQQFDNCVRNCRSSSDYVCIGQCVSSFGQSLIPNIGNPTNSPSPSTVAVSGTQSMNPSASSSINSQSSVNSASSASSALSSASNSIKSEASSKLSSISKSLSGSASSGQIINKVSLFAAAIPFALSAYYF